MKLIKRFVWLFKTMSLLFSVFLLWIMDNTLLKSSRIFEGKYKRVLIWPFKVFFVLYILLHKWGSSIIYIHIFFKVNKKIRLNIKKFFIVKSSFWFKYLLSFSSTISIESILNYVSFSFFFVFRLTWTFYLFVLPVK